MNYKYLTIGLFIIILLLGLIYFTIPGPTESMKNKNNKSNCNKLCSVKGCKDPNYDRYSLECFDGHASDNLDASNSGTNANANTDTDEMRDTDSEIEPVDYGDISSKSNQNNIDLGDQVQQAIKNEIISGEDEVIDNEFQKEKQEKEYGKIEGNELDSKIALHTPTTLVSDSNSMRQMFNKLSDAESLCLNMERRQDLKDNLEQIKINEATLRELEEQDKRISELKQIVKHLRINNQKNEIITKECRSKNQVILNDDYETVKKLADKGLLNDESVKVDLNVSDSLTLPSPSDRNKKSINQNLMENTRSNSYGSGSSSGSGSCKTVDRNKYIHMDKLKDGVCKGCKPKVLKKNINKLYSDFK